MKSLKLWMSQDMQPKKQYPKLWAEVTNYPVQRHFELLSLENNCKENVFSVINFKRLKRLNWEEKVNKMTTENYSAFIFFYLDWQ